MLHDAAQEMSALFGQTQLCGLAAVVGVHRKYVDFCRSTRRIPNGDMRVAAIAGQPFNGFGHERGAVAMFFGYGFGHELEKTVLVRRFQRVVKIPIHL